MPHELEQDGERTAFVSKNLDAWHRLGTVIPEGTSVEEALRIAHLTGWDVRKAPLFTRFSDDSETMVEIPTKFAIIRNNPFHGDVEVLGAERTDTVGRVYTPMQNEEAADWLAEVTDQYGDAELETAGSMRNGTQVFITMKLKGFLVGGVDAVNQYLVYLVNHITGSNISFTTHTRVVCANTCDWALAEARYMFRHTSGIKAKHEQVKQALALSINYNAMFEAEAERMIAEQFDLAQFQALVGELWPVPPEDESDITKRRHRERAGVLRDLFLYADTQEDIRRTKWGAFNAITEYMDHQSMTRGKTEAERAEARALRTIDGTPVKAKAFELLKV